MISSRWPAQKELNGVFGCSQDTLKKTYLSFVYTLWLHVCVLYRIPVCEHVCQCVYMCFLYFCGSFLVCLPCPILIYLVLFDLVLFYYSLNNCMFPNDIKKVCGQEGGLGGIRRREIIIRVYCKNKTMFNKRKINKSWRGQGR